MQIYRFDRDFDQQIGQHDSKGVSMARRIPR
jgi:hypothetical protein